MGKILTSKFYCVSLNLEGGGADKIAYTKPHAKKIMEDYLNECRLRQIEGEVVLSKVHVENYTNHTEEEYFDGVIDDIKETFVESIKISF
jgi:hypothetical protein